MTLNLTIKMSPQPILPLSLDEWLELLETRHSKEIELGLDRVGRVAKQLGLLPSNSFKLDSPGLSGDQNIANPIAKQIIIVAGTNGKGSCVAAIDSILRSAGYQVGTYTSPHFIRYNERICINGVDIDDQSICTAADSTLDGSYHDLIAGRFDSLIRLKQQKLQGNTELLSTRSLLSCNRGMESSQIKVDLEFSIQH